MLSLPAPRLPAQREYVITDNTVADPEAQVRSWTCPACQQTVTGNADTRRAAIRRHARNHAGTRLPTPPPRPRRKR